MFLSFSQFFSRVQESAWYREFLTPVVEKINPGSRVLDVGTGTGKLLQILSTEKPVLVTGTDTSESMLNEARQKLKGLPVTLRKVDPGAVFPFPDSSFDAVTICNVLFNLDRSAREFILNESLRVLQPGGKILVLTPTGSGGLRTLTSRYLVSGNPSIFLWYAATGSNGRRWTKNGWLDRFSRSGQLDYRSEQVFSGLARLETVYSSKKI